MPNSPKGGNRDNSGNSRNTGNKGKPERGFASMDEEKQKEIAKKSGKASHEKGTGHEFDQEEAREAGKKGGSH